MFKRALFRSQIKQVQLFDTLAMGTPVLKRSEDSRSQISNAQIKWVYTSSSSTVINAKSLIQRNTFQRFQLKTFSDFSLFIAQSFIWPWKMQRMSHMECCFMFCLVFYKCIVWTTTRANFATHNRNIFIRLVYSNITQHIHICGKCWYFKLEVRYRSLYLKHLNSLLDSSWIIFLTCIGCSNPTANRWNHVSNVPGSCLIFPEVVIVPHVFQGFYF